MADTMNANLIALGDSDLTLASQDEDIRGRKVFDQAGDEIGDVNELFIDDDENKVRFLQIGAGGFLGIGEKTFLVPVDAITEITDDDVKVDRSRDHVIGGPEYDPQTVKQPDYWTRTCDYYGFAPFWTAGYGYPAYPYYGAAPADPDPRTGV